MNRTIFSKNINLQNWTEFQSQFLQCIHCGVAFPFYKVNTNNCCPNCKITEEEYNWIRYGIGNDD